MRYTDNEVDGRHENRVDEENGNRGFATWGEIDVAYIYIYINRNSRRIWILLLRAEGYLQIVRVNIVTSAKRSGFEHREQRVTFSSSTTELPLRLWLYYPGGSITCTPTRLELVSFQDQREFLFQRTVLYPFIEYSAVGAPVRWALLCVWPSHGGEARCQICTECRCSFSKLVDTSE